MLMHIFLTKVKTAMQTDYKTVIITTALILTVIDRMNIKNKILE